MTVRLLVTGGRDYADRDEVRRVLSSLPPESTVIHGGANGADRTAGEVARTLGLHVEVFPADWNLNGRAAGIIRNRRMLAEGHLSHFYAFPGGRGTADMVRRCEAASVPRWTCSGNSGYTANGCPEGRATGSTRSPTLPATRGGPCRR